MQEKDDHALDQGKEDVDVRDDQVFVQAGVVRDLGQAGAQNKVEGDLGQEEGHSDANAARDVVCFHEEHCV